MNGVGKNLHSYNHQSKSDLDNRSRDERHSKRTLRKQPRVKSGRKRKRQKTDSKPKLQPERKRRKITSETRPKLYLHETTLIGVKRAFSFPEDKPIIIEIRGRKIRYKIERNNNGDLDFQQIFPRVNSIYTLHQNQKYTFDHFRLNYDKENDFLFVKDLSDTSSDNSTRILFWTTDNHS